MASGSNIVNAKGAADQRQDIGTVRGVARNRGGAVAGTGSGGACDNEDTFRRWRSSRADGETMKAERIKVVANEKAEVHVRHSAGTFTLYVVGPGVISILKQEKKARK